MSRFVSKPFKCILLVQIFQEDILAAWVLEKLHQQNLGGGEENWLSGWWAEHFYTSWAMAKSACWTAEENRETLLTALAKGGDIALFFQDLGQILPNQGQR